MVQQRGVQQVNNYLSSGFGELVRIYFIFLNGILIEKLSGKVLLCML